jgi:glycosyltransferase involved in cell wall biosynthesis
VTSVETAPEVDVTVAVPAHGDPAPPIRLLDALESQAATTLPDGPPLRVTVVDDATPRPLGPPLEATARPHLDLHVLRRDRNGGPGAARNVALATIDTTWVAFLDADMVPGPGWLDQLLAVTAAGAVEVDVVEGRVDVPSTGPATPFTHATEFSAPGGHHGAGNVVYRVRRLRSVGGFDEQFFDPARALHFREDTELYFRLRAAGAESTYVDALVAEHPPQPASYRAPILLARRYGFDPLLSRLHPAEFRAMNDARRSGPVSLRRARHDAALAAVAGVILAAGGAAAGRRRIAAGGAGLGLAGWAATAASLSWRRQVRPGHVPPLAGVSLVVPWVYLWNYYRGVLRHRHRPRL